MKEGGRRAPFFRNSHFRIALWYTILLGVVSIAFGVFIFVSQVRDIHGERRFRVTKKMEDTRRDLIAGVPVITQDDDVYALFDSNGRITKVVGLTEDKASSLAKAAFDREKNFRKNSDGHHEKPIAWTEDRLDEEMLYGYMSLSGPEGQSIGDERAYILYGSPLDPYGLRRRLLVTLFIAAAFMLTAAMLSGMWLANRAMRPVALMARTARSIGEGNFSQRINLGTRDELGELSTVFDAMLDRLEAAFEYQKRFIADASHELRTPLSIISLESDRALSSERTGQDYRQSLSVVQTECRYMARLIDELLTLAKVDSGGAEKEFESVDLSDIAVDAMERYAPLASPAGIALSAGLLPEAIVRGNRAALATAIGNLIDNAIKYSRGPGGRVDVSLETGEREAVIRVADDGSGIPPDRLERVFERFYRVDEAHADRENAPAGSGLGLAIVKAIAESMGGRVAVESELDHGSAFSIFLPLAK
jgi:signal transduction histidine kinase